MRTFSDKATIFILATTNERVTLVVVASLMNLTSEFATSFGLIGITEEITSLKHASKEPTSSGGEIEGEAMAAEAAEGKMKIMLRRKYSLSIR